MTDPSPTTPPPPAPEPARGRPPATGPEPAGNPPPTGGPEPASGPEPAGNPPPTGGPEPAGEPPEHTGGPQPTTAEPELASRVAELEDRLLRTLADLDNLRKRMAAEVAAARADERRRVAQQWLPVVDSLDNALSHADAEPAVILEGIQAVREQALAILAQLGFPRHTEPGARFDPHQHDAVAVVPAAAPPGTVVDVIRPGYGTGRQQLRPASVVVAKESDGDHT